MMMLQELLEAGEHESWGDLRARLGRFLSLDRAVPSPAMRRIVEDPEFAHDILVSRNAPAFLEVLLNDPENARWAADEVPEEHTNAELARKAFNSFLAWGRSGFATVDDATYRQRLAICASCDHYVDPPSKLAYKVALTSRDARKICDACGCTVSRKARLTTESCPLADPLRPGFDRWGLPRNE